MIDTLASLKTSDDVINAKMQIAVALLRNCASCMQNKAQEAIQRGNTQLAARYCRQLEKLTNG